MRSDHLSKHIKTHSKPRKSGFPFKSPMSSPNGSSAAPITPTDMGTSPGGADLSRGHNRTSGLNNNNSPPLCLSGVNDLDHFTSGLSVCDVSGDPRAQHAVAHDGFHSILSNEHLLKSQLADLECLINDKNSAVHPFAHCPPMSMN